MNTPTGDIVMVDPGQLCCVCGQPLRHPSDYAADAPLVQFAHQTVAHADCALFAARKLYAPEMADKQATDIHDTLRTTAPRAVFGNPQ